MICRYNRAQWVRAGFALVGGLACFFMAYLFFRYLPAFVAWQLGCPWNPVPAWIVTALGLGAVAFSGYRIWRAGGGLQGYHESALHSGGSLCWNHRSRQHPAALRHRRPCPHVRQLLLDPQPGPSSPPG